MKHFRQAGNHYAYDIESIFREIDWYQQMMAVWQERLPNVIPARPATDSREPTTIHRRVPDRLVT